MKNSFKLGSIVIFTVIMMVIASVSMYLAKDIEIGLIGLIGVLIVSVIAVIITSLVKNPIVTTLTSIVVPILLGVLAGKAMDMYVAKLGMDFVLVIFLGASILFAITGIFGYFIKKDLSGLGIYLTIGLIAAIIGGIIGVVLGQGEIFFIVLSVITLVIFSLYNIKDFNEIKRNLDYMEFHEIPSYSLNLFLNLFNMFLDLLRIVSYFTGNDD